LASRNNFERKGDIVFISNPSWDFIASASIRDDYADELENVTWSKNGSYLYSSRLKVYLHVYIMQKWYGDDVYEEMRKNQYVVDHMDNDGHNCCIDNLCFLINDENKAKGMTVDKMSQDRSHIALTMIKDFQTQLIQMTIHFNYPATAVISGLSKPAVIELVYLLYDCEYEMVINDARSILYDYRRDFTFQPEKLHFIDYDIEGAYGVARQIETYDEYLARKHGHGVALFVKRAPLRGWNKDTKINRLNIHTLRV
jgi:hypothetical protein